MKLRGQGLKDMRAVVFFDGKVFVNFASAIVAPVEAVMMSFRSLLKPCEAIPFDSYNLVHHLKLPVDFQTAYEQQVLESTFKVFVNRIEDWTLEGSQTIQVQLVDRDQPCTIKLNRIMKVLVDRTNMIFFANMATHRAQALLHVEFVHSETSRRQQKSIFFQNQFVGGRFPDGYQQVSLGLPDWRGEVEISLQLEYISYVDDSSGFDPFLFLADIQVSKSTDVDRALVSPHLAFGMKTLSDGNWLCANLPAPASRGVEFALMCGKERKIINLPKLPNITTSNQGEHIIAIDSDAPTELTLYVDGKFENTVSVRTGSTIIALNERHYDGSIHHLCLRDRSGTAQVWEDVALVPAFLTKTDTMQRISVGPYPSAIFRQTPYRYASLRALLASNIPDRDLSQIPNLLKTVEAGYGNVRLFPISFPYVEKPDVSIVIPVHNNIEVTFLALCSLIISHNEATYEVIIVDDGSTDRTAELGSIVSGITVLRNAEPQRFIRACNIGAESTRGDFIVLLNNDVELTPGWLDELRSAFNRFNNVGLVGAKLLYPDGRLQEAGGIIWRSGNPQNYGRGENPEDPRYCYARQADYLSGAAVMLPKSVWREVGGLSSYLEPMYFEDTDLSFKVRAAGYTTWFVPSSVVFHHEGMTAGTDVREGLKRYQEVNCLKFKRRWSGTFSRFGREGENADIEKDRGIHGRVLFIDYTTPRADKDAGSYAAFQEIRLVQSLGYKVTFLPLNMAHFGKYTEDLQKLGVEMVYAPFYSSPESFLEQRGAEFDAFYITRYHVARDVLTKIRTHAPEGRVLFNNADLHFLRELRAAKVTNDKERILNARRVREEELDVISKVDVVLSYNVAEHSIIEAYSECHAKVIQTPWVVDIPKHLPPLANRSGLTFLGNFAWGPNADGVIWFAREVMPLLRKKKGSLILSIYGAELSKEIVALDSTNVKPIGFVQDVAEAFDTHRIFVAPMRSGAGLKGKVLEALARGVPCILSPIAAEGIGLRHGHDCFIARTVDDWITAITQLNEDDELWKRISENAQNYVKEKYSFEAGRLAMREAFEVAGVFSLFSI